MNLEPVVEPPDVRVCVIGHPVAHSRSPMIHDHWLAERGRPERYGRADVAPAAFPAFVAAMPARGLIGANVTVPHKEAAFAACARTTASARALGAVNTLWFEDGLLCGDNTDVAGFLGNLDQNAAGWDRAQNALVLGAGGAARGIVFALLQRRIGRIVVANRSLDRAQDLAGRFGAPVEVVPWDMRDQALGEADLIVNTTSLGMNGKPPLELAIDRIRPGTLVTDIVYVPLQTPLLGAARAYGLPTVDGLGMLLHQAAPSFARWFGTQPEVTPALRALVEADLEADTR